MFRDLIISIQKKNLYHPGYLNILKILIKYFLNKYWDQKYPNTHPYQDLMICDAIEGSFSSAVPCERKFIYS